MELQPMVDAQELPGMPAKEEATIIAERILELKENLVQLREELSGEKARFVNEMRLKQKSNLLVNGFEFEVILEDKVTITKTKKAF